MSRSSFQKETYLQIYWRALRQTKGWLVAQLVFLVLAELFLKVQPFILKKFVNDLVLQNAVQAGRWLFLALTILFFADFFHRIYASLERKVSLQTFARIDEHALRRALEQSYGFFINTQSGQVLTKIKVLAASFEKIFSISQEVLRFIIGGSITLVALARQGGSVFLLGVAYIIIGGLYALRASRRMRAFNREKSDTRSKMVGYEADILSQAPTVLLFGAQAHEIQGFRKRATIFIQAWSARAFRNQRDWDGIVAISFFFEAGVIWMLYRGWQAGTVTIGDFVLCQALIAGVIRNVHSSMKYMGEWQDASVDAEEAMKLLNQEPDVQDLSSAKKLRIKKGEIVFEHVNFQYGEASAVLTDINLTIAPRERVAFVGRSGAGKSTIVKLLLRLHNLSSGAIRVDGQPIHLVTQNSLREVISYVPQEPLLFHRSIRENISYGSPNASDRQIIAAAKQAHCHEFISNLEKGYDSLVGERGVKLSGGERQRVAIARAILKNAPILVLDEATSSLDPESEQLIQAAMDELMKKKTVIVIAHRLSTIRHMDRVIVLDEGKIADQGTHDDLLKHDTLYRDFWHRQTKGYQKGA